MQTEAPAPLLVPRIEAARLLSISESSVDRLVKAGRLPRLKVLGASRYDMADIRQLVAEFRDAAQGVLA